MPQTTVSMQQLALEKPPGIERPLYLICCDRIIREADPTESLFEALVYNNLSRLTVAKTLTAESQCLQHVPVVARERFLELVNATPTTAGITIITDDARQMYMLFFIFVFTSHSSTCYHSENNAAIPQAQQLM
jgi:hypothetical protein